MPHSGPSTPPDAFVKIIRGVLDKGDAQEGDPDRGKALETLNVVLAREGWQAFYDEHGIGNSAISPRTPLRRWRILTVR